MELSPFDNTDDSTMGVEFWIIQKFTRGIIAETVKIWVDSIQKVNNKYRIIDTA